MSPLDLVHEASAINQAKGKAGLISLSLASLSLSCVPSTESPLSNHGNLSDQMNLVGRYQANWQAYLSGV